MSMVDRFHAAVNVIRSLPKNGSYQPSHDMMLRFYSYFKQATEGKCKGKRPAFWDIVGRAKYDAWKRLGDMPEERAMELYVEELKKIVETMSYTDNVADFYGSIHELENVNIEDLAMIAPETIQKQRSNPNSPIHSVNQSRTNSRDGSPTRISHNSITDTSDDEYIDTVDDDFPTSSVENSQRKDKWKNASHQNGGLHYDFKKQPMVPEMTNQIDPSMILHLMKINDKMQMDLDQVNNKINSLEKKITKLKNRPSWWPIWLRDVSPFWLTFSILWPVTVAIIMRSNMQSRRRLN